MVGTPVGTALIDAHAGGVGTMESLPETESKDDGLSKYQFYLIVHDNIQKQI